MLMRSFMYSLFVVLCVYMCICIYIYIKRERERERVSYIYIYILFWAARAAALRLASFGTSLMGT